MVKLPGFFQTLEQINLNTSDGFSYLQYKQTLDQKRVQVFLSKSLLVFILKGKKIIHGQNEELVIHEGEGFFSQKGTHLLSDKINEQGQFESLIFFIDDQLIKDFTKKNWELIPQNPGGAEVPKVFKIQVSDLLKASLESIMPYFTQDFPHKQALMNLKFEELLHLLISTEPQGNFLSYLGSRKSVTDGEFQNLMEKSYTLPLTLEDLAIQAGLSLTSFKNKFHKLYGISPRRWIITQRLALAKKLLSQSEKNVTEVCYEVGFNNVSHFIQQFKNAYAVTPGELLSNSVI